MLNYVTGFERAKIQLYMRLLLFNIMEIINGYSTKDNIKLFMINYKTYSSDEFSVIVLLNGTTELFLFLS